MSTNQRPASSFGMAREKTFFEQQRELLIGEIAMVCPPSPFSLCPNQSIKLYSPRARARAKTQS